MPPQPSNAEVLAQVEALAEDMLELLSASVRQASESGWEDRVTGLYAEWFARRGWPVIRQPIASTGLADGEPRAEWRENLIAWFRGRRGRPCMVLNGHLDVVPRAMSRRGRIRRTPGSVPTAGCTDGAL
ncbi:hypothetical protein [Nonomuraea sp. NPDC049141]|uniref:hypothetical protein n=1 Tax=Nonomuraea sp. NPDC049141 TaxID=3155500 RepID=UPI0033E91964